MSSRTLTNAVQAGMWPAISLAVIYSSACNLDYPVEAEQRTVAIQSNSWPAEVSLGDTIALNVTLWTTGGDTTARLQVRDANGQTLTPLVTFKSLSWTTAGTGELRRLQDSVPLPNSARFVAERAGTVRVTVALADPAIHGKSMTDTLYIAHPWSTAPGAVSAGPDRTCAVDGLDRVYCWGRGATTNTLVPARPFASDTFPAVSVSVGDEHACAIELVVPSEHVSFMAFGPFPYAFCWGNNQRGQVGGGDITTGTQPTRNMGASEMADLVAGGEHTCVHLLGYAYCWGDNTVGQLGRGDVATPCPGQGGGSCDPFPNFVANVTTFATLAARAGYTCGTTRAEQLFCWGGSSTGALGLGKQVLSVNAPALVAYSEPIVQVTAGMSHSCALSSGGGAICWGSDAYHETGASSGQDTCGVTTCVPSPTAVQLGLRFTSLSAGDGFTCGIATSGRVYCWGRNDRGQLGTDAMIADRCGSTPCSIAPHPIASDARFVTVTAGGGQACAVSTRRELYCWGRNDYGQIGDGSTTTRTTPVRVGR